MQLAQSKMYAEFMRCVERQFSALEIEATDVRFGSLAVHLQRNSECLLYPRKRTFRNAVLFRSFRDCPCIERGIYCA